MFCTKCGAELPEQANFCWKCCLPQRDDVEAPNSRYEVCEITFRTVKNSGFGPWIGRFVAESVGLNGTYKVAESGDFNQGATSKKARQKKWNEFDALIAKLIADGWEYVGLYGDGESDWQRRFRRRIRE